MGMVGAFVATHHDQEWQERNVCVRVLVSAAEHPQQPIHIRGQPPKTVMAKHRAKGQPHVEDAMVTGSNAIGVLFIFFHLSQWCLSLLLLQCYSTCMYIALSS
jgi:hypothetical protein